MTFDVAVVEHYDAAFFQSGNGCFQTCVTAEAINYDYIEVVVDLHD
jgi:hypothetical protein